MESELWPLALAGSVGVVVGRAFARRDHRRSMAGTAIETTTRTAGLVTAGALHGAGFAVEGAGSVVVLSGHVAHALARTLQRSTNGVTAPAPSLAG